MIQISYYQVVCSSVIFSSNQLQSLHFWPIYEKRKHVSETCKTYFTEDFPKKSEPLNRVTTTFFRMPQQRIFKSIWFSSADCYKSHQTTQHNVKHLTLSSKFEKVKFYFVTAFCCSTCKIFRNVTVREHFRKQITCLSLSYKNILTW